MFRIASATGLWHEKTMSSGSLPAAGVQAHLSVDTGIPPWPPPRRPPPSGLDLIVTGPPLPPRGVTHAYAVLNPNQSALALTQTKISAAQASAFKLGLRLFLKNRSRSPS